MIDIDKYITDDRMVRKLRSLGCIVEERHVEKWSGNEPYKVWVWQIRVSDDKWMDARPLYRDIVADKISQVVEDCVTFLDVAARLKV